MTFLVVNWTIPSAGQIIITETNDILGIPGQGLIMGTMPNQNPRSYFISHAIVKFNNAYYDPSYGTPVRSSKLAWEDNSLDAIGGIYFKNPAASNPNQKLFWVRDANQLGGISQININP